MYNKKLLATAAKRNIFLISQSDHCVHVLVFHKQAVNIILCISLCTVYRLALCRTFQNLMSILHFLPHHGFKIDHMSNSGTHSSRTYSTQTKLDHLVLEVLGVCSHSSDSELPIVLFLGDARQDERVHWKYIYSSALSDDDISLLQSSCRRIIALWLYRNWQKGSVCLKGKLLTTAARDTLQCVRVATLHFYIWHIMGLHSIFAVFKISTVTTELSHPVLTAC